MYKRILLLVTMLLCISMLFGCRVNNEDTSESATITIFESFESDEVKDASQEKPSSSVEKEATQVEIFITEQDYSNHLADELLWVL